MSKNNKRSSKEAASEAAKTLRNSEATEAEKKLAGSVLAQSGTDKETGKAMERVASLALKNSESGKIIKTLAGSVLSQSNKKR